MDFRGRTYNLEDLNKYNIDLQTWVTGRRGKKGMVKGGTISGKTRHKDW